MSGAEQAWSVGVCLLVNGQSVSDWSPDACTIGEGAGPDVLLFGDSFAAHYVPGLKAASSGADARVIEYAMEGCPPTLASDSPGSESCHTFREHVLDIVDHMDIKHVIIASSWLEYGTEASSEIESTLTALKAAGVDVTLIGQSPNFHIPPYLILARSVPPNTLDAGLPLSAQARAMNRRLSAIAARAGVHFIDPTVTLCPEGQCRVRAAGEDLYLDYGHFTPAGSVRAVEAYFPYPESGQ